MCHVPGTRLGAGGGVVRCSLCPHPGVGSRRAETQQLEHRVLKILREIHTGCKEALGE